ncbi:hypothetical protein [Shumkonia mesophila]|uniref:hypothetical protein n=1 Tax=Shumkonia mesophila TaxID=2838854 RepID=UPI0029341EB6|nr:hypothetical protein [Shumkonia mesophila]
MSFVFPLGGRTFFKLVEAHRDGFTKFIMFDAYYCCLMAGLDVRKIGNDGDLEGDVFVNGYPDDYKDQADILAGLLIDAELDRKGIKADDKASIENEMIQLVNPTSATRLSENGNKLLNLYAAAGFKILQDRMMPPASLDEFIVAYHSYWHTGSVEPAI